MARRINAPGTEVNEIDRSSYEETVDNSTVGTATLVLGFGDKGDDYTVRWMNTMNTFEKTYGTPTNDAEKYFYNAVYEIIAGGGTCYAAKLPYYNDSFNNFVYTSYTIDSRASYISSVTENIVPLIKKNSSVTHTLSNLLFNPNQLNDISSVYSNKNYTFESESQNELVEFVKSRTNMDSETIDFLNSILLSSAINRRNSVYVINNILSFTGNNKNQLPFLSSVPGDYDQYIERIKSAIQDVFGADASSSTIAREFQKHLFLDDYKRYYNRLSSDFKDIGTDVYNKIIFQNTNKFDEKYTEIKTVDDTLKTYVQIRTDETPQKNEIMSYESFDKFLVNELRVPINKIYIVDKTRGKYGKDIFGNEFIGVMPVITTAANALFFQGVIPTTNERLPDYNVIAGVRNSYRKNISGAFKESLKPVDQTDSTISAWNTNSSLSVNEFVGLNDYLGNEQFQDGTRVTVNDYTISQNAAEHFPTITFINNRLDRELLQQIGVVVFKLFKDPANNNKIAFTPVESFVGSLDRTAKDQTTGDRIFIDDIVNNNSRFISMFSNANIPENKSDDPLSLKNASIYVINNQNACSMGFYERDMLKNIHVTESIYKPMLKVFEKSEDRNTLDVDIILDGGVSNIAQYIASTQFYGRDGNNQKTTTYEKNEFLRYGPFNLNDTDSALFKLESVAQCNVWRKVLERFDEFAKNVRKDCMFIADGPRPFCLDGNAKIIRATKPENTIKKTILPKMRFIAGALNSSYSAGYLNWFWSLDQSTGEYMWMPPSIKALGVYLYTDNYGAYWDAPAGLNRGRIGNTLDVAFNPTNEEAGQIYINSWNYAISYPLDGIILEGQKTFQRNKTALDRINVRRLMLGMEKTIAGFCKYFNYEGNTSFQRSRLSDTIERYLEQVRANDGISQYIVVCDERNNTTETIENNELHIAIAVRPVKTIEFIILNFIATNQSVDVSEAIAAELGT